MSDNTTEQKFGLLAELQDGPKDGEIVDHPGPLVCICFPVMEKKQYSAADFMRKPTLDDLPRVEIEVYQPVSPFRYRHVPKRI